MAQLGVLQGLRVQLILGLARTTTKPTSTPEANLLNSFIPGGSPPPVGN